MAASVPVSLAALNVAKALVLALGLALLASAVASGRPLERLRSVRSPWLVVAMLAALGASLAYTEVPVLTALPELAKYGKLLVIPLVLVLIRTPREASIALAIYGGAQCFVVLSSYLLSTGLQLPWVIKGEAQRQAVGAVFSTYLDQSIMTAGLAVLCWHLRDRFASRHARMAVGFVCALCALNVLFLLPGRSGHVALIAGLLMAIPAALPRQHRAKVLLVSAVVAITLPLAAPQFRERMAKVASESAAYVDGDRSPTSSTGTRLNFWQRSLEAIGERPLTGYGVGSWNQEYLRLEGVDLRAEFAHLRNPHQEYLLWGVQLGLGGIALFCLFLNAMQADARVLTRDAGAAARSFVVMLAMVCLFNSTLFDALIGDYFCLLIGLLFALGLSDARAGTPGRIAGAPAQGSLIDRLALASVTQPLSRPVPAESGPAYLAAVGRLKVARRVAWRRVVLRMTGQDDLKLDRFPPGSRKLLWIYFGEEQIGDGLMDLAHRSLLVERGYEVDLFTSALVARLYQGDPWFSRVSADPAGFRAADYACALILSNKHRPLKQKIRHFPQLPWVSIHEFFTGPNFHRGLFAAQRAADLAGVDLDAPGLESHGSQKLRDLDGSAPPPPGDFSQSIALAIGGVHEDRTYEGWIGVVRGLVAGGQRSFVLVGSHNGAARAAALVSALQGQADIADFTGALSLDETRSLLGACAVAVCPDGGLMHLAVTTPVKLVGLFSSRIAPQWRLPTDRLGGALVSGTERVSDIAPEDIVRRVLRVRTESAVCPH
ncbi:O-antigen ligase family protein [Caenimonas aquaedulcis]|uniref:O-antigen ligase family protein n=1 Tax=Caenimonas aquaedulcis TaxID=2793270 RepID=A0A931H1L3_9BURK|nr:O-antigen ligase family protein [Caenimonas aquaedulcis]MBG9386865.1 O-antigen ligase family protein [Caenimonas aquaedulcis]